MRISDWSSDVCSSDLAFESLVQCGDGAFRVSVEYARDDVFDQDLFLRPIEDCHAVVWDRFSVDPTGRDAKRVFVDDKLQKDDFERTWPGICEAALDSGMSKLGRASGRERVGRSV